MMIFGAVDARIAEGGKVFDKTIQNLDAFALPFRTFKRNERPQIRSRLVFPL